MLAFLANPVRWFSFQSHARYALLAAALATSSVCLAQSDDPFAEPAAPDPAKPAAQVPAAKPDTAKQNTAPNAKVAADPDRPSSRWGQKDSPIEILSASERNILLELEKPSKVEFVEEPLADVVSDLKDQHGIEIRLDDKALDDAGIARDTPITLSATKAMPFRSILGLLRRHYGLYYLVQDGMLLLTTKDAVESEDNLVRMVYPVGDLIKDEDGNDDYFSLINAITKTIDSSMWREFPRAQHSALPASPTTAKRSASLQATPPAQPQPATAGMGGTSGGMGGGFGGMGAIRDAGVGGSGGPGTVVIVDGSHSLVIAQTREVHEKIQDLLRSLRIARNIANDAGKSQ